VKHMFVCKTIWAPKNVQDEDVKITQLAKKIRGHALVSCMNMESTTPIGQHMMLLEII
jgi:hypothetical protein